MPYKTIGSLMVRLNMDPREVDQQLKKLQRNLTQMGKQMEQTGRMMTVGFTVPFVLAMRSAIKAYDEEAQAVKKLEVALGRTSKALIDQAAAIQKVTIYSDDSVLAAQAWAAALGHSESEVSRMTTAAVDLAAALGIGLDEAMKALHLTTVGNTRGIAKYIPEVKNLTKEQLAAGEAIDIVNKKFHGFAEAAGQTGLGPIKIMQNQMGDLMEQFGEVAIPILNKMIGIVSNLMDGFKNLSPEMKGVIVQFGALAALAGPLLLLSGNIIKLVHSLNALKIASAGGIFKGGLFMGASWAAGQALQSGNDSNNLLNTMANMAYAGGKQSEINETRLRSILNAAGHIFSGEFGQAQAILDITSGRNFQANKKPIGRGSMGGYQNFISSLGGTPSGGGGGGPRTPRAGSITDPLTALYGSNYFPNFSPIPVSARGGGPGLSMPIPNMDPGSTGTHLFDGDMGEAMSSTIEDLEKMQESWMGTADIISNAVGQMSQDLASGMPFFAAFGKAALRAAAQVARAALIETASKIVSDSAVKGGLPGALIGIAGAIGVVSMLEGLIGKIGTPKIAAAEGGMTTGITPLIAGDNPSGKELFLPFEKTGIFSDMIAKKLGSNGMTSQVVGVIRGDDIHLVTTRAQDRTIRRGGGTVITF